MAARWLAQEDKDVFAARTNNRAFLPVQLQSHWGLLPWMGFCGVSLNPSARVDLTDTDRPEEWSFRLCSGAVVHLPLGLYPTTTGRSYRNLGLNYSN